MNVSSAYFTSSHGLAILHRILFTYMLNKRGPKKAPYGTPWNSSIQSEDAESEMYAIKKTNSKLHYFLIPQNLVIDKIGQTEHLRTS